MKIEIRKLSPFYGEWGYKVLAFDEVNGNRRYYAARRFETEPEAAAYKKELERRYANELE